MNTGQAVDKLVPGGKHESYPHLIRSPASAYPPGFIPEIHFRNKQLNVFSRVLKHTISTSFLDLSILSRAGTARTGRPPRIGT
jgi:hypothetical protein